ncbi:hypothetical protein [Streptomyces sp. CBMA152]|uniref:hypothetical protein n=1 Tax=Streptomyces sp. CBMA152 TaxID=1896312 RepID=UPI0016608CD7|nr:hypothetical protein [Streptomyces sp. CBMA152]MBD0743599.1 hypothetical protein [Streptomyces sp. CBMA152]
MWLRKTAGVPASAPGGYTWETLDDVVGVPDDLGLDLVAIPGASFVEAPAPNGEDEVSADSVEPLPIPNDSGVVEAPTAPKRGRPRKTTQSEISE